MHFYYICCMISHRQLFLEHVAQCSEEPMGLEIEKANGMYLIGHDKKRYLDLIAGIAVSNLGHRHPEVHRAIIKQLKKYTHLMVYGEMIQSPQVKLAKKLADVLPTPLSSTYFVNSGAEAVEGAMKLAKRYTGRSEIIACKNSYHGSTQGAMSLMGGEYFKNAFRPLLPDIRHIEFNHLEDVHQITSKTACIVVEAIQGESGATPATKEWLQAIRKRCNETGTLFVLDEIQTGFGRTGKLFAFEHYDIVPDILLLAKGFGGGLPLGAFITSKEIMWSLTNNPVLGHMTTFGGHPVSCAASLATLKILLRENYIQEVEEKEQLFREQLQHPSIIKISGKGLLLSVQFESSDLNKKIIKQCLKNGIVTDWFLFNDYSFRVAPPLIITHEQIKKACKIILKSIDEISN